MEGTGAGACYAALADGETLAFNGPGLRLVSGPITVTGVSIGDSSPLALVTSGAMRYAPDPSVGVGGYVGDDLAAIEPSEKPYVAGTRSALVGQTFSPPPGGVVPLLEVRVHWPHSDTAVRQTAKLSDLTLTHRDGGGEEHTVVSPLNVTVSNRKGGSRGWTGSTPSPS